MVGKQKATLRPHRKDFLTFAENPNAYNTLFTGAYETIISVKNLKPAANLFAAGFYR